MFKNIICIIVMLIVISACKSSSGTSAAAVSRSCGSFSLDDDLVETVYSGDIVTTSGNCGETYTVYAEVNYNIAGSVTGWRQINHYLDTSGGNINFTSGGRWQTIGSAQAESTGLQFSGVDNTTCQNAHGLNGSADLFEYTVTAEFDSNCQPRLRGTFMERARCSDNSYVEICSGTILLTK